MCHLPVLNKYCQVNTHPNQRLYCKADLKDGAKHVAQGESDNKAIIRDNLTQLFATYSEGKYYKFLEWKGIISFL